MITLILLAYIFWKLYVKEFSKHLTYLLSSLLFNLLFVLDARGMVFVWSCKLHGHRSCYGVHCKYFKRSSTVLHGQSGAVC